jgi:hypothetical protein
VRTAVYHAGVLRALHEAGVKIDLVAGPGVGAAGAALAAIGGSSRAWEETGVWRSPRVATLYQWKRTQRTLPIAIAALAWLLIARWWPCAGMDHTALVSATLLIACASVAGLCGLFVRLARQASAGERTLVVASFRCASRCGICARAVRQRNSGI